MIQMEATNSPPSSIDQLQREASEKEMETLISGNTTVIGYADQDSVLKGVDGVYLSPYLKYEYGTDVELTDIQLLPDTTRLGEGKSHHDVMFSELTVSQNGEEPKKIDVALKRYSTKSGQAFRELELTERVREKGYETFETLAIIVAGDISVLATKKETIYMY